MRLRRRWVLAGLVGLVLALPWLLWGGYALLARIRGEHFYHGLPSSYWKQQLGNWGEGPLGRMAWAPSELKNAAFYLGLGYPPAAPIATSGDPAVLPVLLDLLGDSDPFVREKAVTALNQFPRPVAGVIPALVGALGDNSPAVRAQAASVLGQLGAPAAVAVPCLRANLLRALWVSGGGLRFYPEGVPMEDREAASALGRIDPEAAAWLAVRLADPDPAFRRRLVWAMQWCGREALDALVQTLGDEDKEVREGAAGILASGFGALAVPRLAGALHGPSARQRCMAAAVLARIGKDARGAVSSLEQALRDEDRAVREAAAKALRAIDPEAAARAGVR
jgi:hypothetical protein